MTGLPNPRGGSDLPTRRIQLGADGSVVPRAADGVSEQVLSQPRFKCLNCHIGFEFCSGRCPSCHSSVVKNMLTGALVPVLLNEKPGLTCGCGRHGIDPKDNKVVMYKGAYWLLRCLFFKVDQRMPKVVRKYKDMERQAALARKMRLKFIQMKKLLRTVPCAKCDHNAGNRFAIIGDALYCGTCAREATFPE